MSLAAWLLVTTSLFAVQESSADSPARRTVEYPWMSVQLWNDFHASFLKRADEGPVEILFLGDSITQGWAFDGKEVWQAHYAERAAANFGIGGDTTQQVLWRIGEGGELEKVRPKVCVLMIGTNNFGIRNDDADEVAKGIEATVAAIRAKLPETKVLLLGIFPRDAAADTDYRRRIAKVNERIAKLDDGAAIRYLDLGPKFLQADGTLSAEIMPDFLHLSPRGYEIWADSMEPLLSEMLR